MMNATIWIHYALMAFCWQQRSQKVTDCIISFMWHSQNDKSSDKEQSSGCQGLGVEKQCNKVSVRVWGGGVTEVLAFCLSEWLHEAIQLDFPVC